LENPAIFAIYFTILVLQTLWSCAAKHNFMEKLSALPEFVSIDFKTGHQYAAHAIVMPRKKKNEN